MKKQNRAKMGRGRSAVTKVHALPKQARAAEGVPTLEEMDSPDRRKAAQAAEEAMKRIQDRLGLAAQAQEALDQPSPKSDGERPAPPASGEPPMLRLVHKALAGTSAAAFLLRHADRLSEQGVLFMLSESVVAVQGPQPRTEREITLTEIRPVPDFFNPSYYARREQYEAITMNRALPMAQIDKYDYSQPRYSREGAEGGSSAPNYAEQSLAGTEPVRSVGWNR